jgi:hypothetical protein
MEHNVPANAIPIGIQAVYNDLCDNDILPHAQYAFTTAGAGDMIPLYNDRNIGSCIKLVADYPEKDNVIFSANVSMRA